MTDNAATALAGIALALGAFAAMCGLSDRDTSLERELASEPRERMPGPSPSPPRLGSHGADRSSSRSLAPAEPVGIADLLESDPELARYLDGSLRASADRMRQCTDPVRELPREQRARVAAELVLVVAGNDGVGALHIERIEWPEGYLPSVGYELCVRDAWQSLELAVPPGDVDARVRYPVIVWAPAVP